MKIRIGFVSNSSSSSFLGVGWQLDPDQIEQFIQTHFDPNFKNEDAYVEIQKYLNSFYPDLTMREDLILIQIPTGNERLEELEQKIIYLKKELKENVNLQKIIKMFGEPQIILDELGYY